MANQSTTGFGLRPLRNVHQGDHNAGLGEWKKAASTTAIDHHDMVLLAASGYVTVATAGAGVINQLGSLNGSRFILIPLQVSQHGPTGHPIMPQQIMTCLVNDNPSYYV